MNFERVGERKKLKIGRWILLGIILVTAAVFLVRWYSSRRAEPAITALPVREYPDSVLEVRAPEGVRIKVEVVNTTKTRGWRAAPPHISATAASMLF